MGSCWSPPSWWSASGRVGDIYGRVRMYNLGFAIFTSSRSCFGDVADRAGRRAVDHHHAGLPGVGGAFLFANSTAILTDAFPENERGKAMGINGIAAVGGSFLGLILGGVLAPIEWRLVFLVSVPFGLFGTVWAYLKLRDNGVRIPARIDWVGNATFAAGLIALLIGIVYSLLPYGGHTTGWTNPWVLAASSAGSRSWRCSCWIEIRCPSRCSGSNLFRIRAFTAGNIAGLLGALGRGGLQFMLIIWLQGIWLPQHGYSFSQTPLWAGIYMIPLTLGFLLLGPLAGILSDRYGARLLATGRAGRVRRQLPAPRTAADQLQLRVVRAAHLPVRRRHGAVLLAEPGRVMNSLPPDQRGAGAGMLNTFQNSATVLSMGLFFTIVTLGLASRLPAHLYRGLVAAGVPAAAAHTWPASRRSAACSPPSSASTRSSSCSARPAPCTTCPPQAAYVTGRSFFPNLIEQPFATGLHLAFTFAAGATAIAVVASALRGRRYLHPAEPVPRGARRRRRRDGRSGGGPGRDGLGLPGLLPDRERG